MTADEGRRVAAAVLGTALVTLVFPDTVLGLLIYIGILLLIVVGCAGIYKACDEIQCWRNRRLFKKHDPDGWAALNKPISERDRPPL